jgi:RHS repeat-associated protein
MRYTINGSPPTSTSGTLIASSSGTVRLTPSPAGTTLQVIAFKAGMNDSGVNVGTYYYESDNGAGMNNSAVNSANMPNPGDGGPGGGGILIDGGDQPTINYDANGNLTNYKGWTYSYDAQNRLINAVNGSVSAQFYYDGKNRQIARNINGVIRFNSWDGWELLEEYGSGLTVAKGYLQGATGVIKSWDPIYGQLYYYQDKLGSTTHVANAIGQLVESFHYDLTGTPTETSTHGVVDLYAGERWIPELRLYDLRNRFMSPELGRFLQPDPIGFKGDASNLYRYCGNDPVDRSDPTGLQDEPPTLRLTIETQRLVSDSNGLNPHWVTVSSGTMVIKDNAGSNYSVTVNGSVPHVFGSAVAQALGIQHQWISTNAGQSVGMGNAQGRVPGENRESSPNCIGAKTYLVDHHGRTGDTQKHIRGVDKGALDSYLTPGTYSGLWMPWNQCNTWVSNALASSTPHNVMTLFGARPPGTGYWPPYVMQPQTIPNKVQYFDGSLHDPAILSR